MAYALRPELDIRCHPWLKHMPVFPLPARGRFPAFRVGAPFRVPQATRIQHDPHSTRWVRVQTARGQYTSQREHTVRLDITNVFVQMTLLEQAAERIRDLGYDQTSLDHWEEMTETGKAWEPVDLENFALFLAVVFKPTEAEQAEQAQIELEEAQARVHVLERKVENIQIELVQAKLHLARLTAKGQE